MTARRTDADAQRELAALALCPDDSLLDLLCEDGLVTPAQAQREHSPAQLLALLRRIFSETAAPAPPRAASVQRPHSVLSDARFSLRAPPAALCA